MPEITQNNPKPDEPVDQFLRDAVESVRRTRVALKGPIMTPIGTGSGEVAKTVE